MRLEIKSTASIRKVAKQFVEAMQEYTVFAFHGGMGVGKTTFIKAICEELGVTDTINSPTFAIVNEYESGGGSPIYHFDFYRIKSVREAIDIGCEEYFSGGNLCFVEWPEEIAELLPSDTVSVTITAQPDGVRTLEFAFPNE